jgi:hypothetical protein
MLGRPYWSNFVHDDMVFTSKFTPFAEGMYFSASLLADRVYLPEVLINGLPPAHAGSFNSEELSVDVKVAMAPHSAASRRCHRNLAATTVRPLVSRYPTFFLCPDETQFVLGIEVVIDAEVELVAIDIRTISE